MNYAIVTIYSNGKVRYEAIAEDQPLSKETFLPARYPRLSGIKGEGSTPQEAIADLKRKLTL
jgi:hypothetical protein